MPATLVQCRIGQGYAFCIALADYACVILLGITARVSQEPG
jgi:hypothetical protein